jgi:DNA-binding MarR family transcriptional regulator
MNMTMNMTPAPTTTVDQDDASAERRSEVCVQAWFALKNAHTRVSDCLSTSLARHCQLGISDFEALLYLGAPTRARARITDLGEAVALSQPALSRLVARLEERGLLMRSKAEGDQRAVLVALTEAGHAARRQAIPFHTACVTEHFLQPLTGEEHATLVAILNRIR